MAAFIPSSFSSRIVKVALPDDLFAGTISHKKFIYIDHYGNAWTGQRAASVQPATRIVAGGAEFRHADTFGAVGKGEGLWFANSVGLIELAINRGSAPDKLGLKVGDTIQVFKPN